jgi:uncharacterized membrane protein
MTSDRMRRTNPAHQKNTLPIRQAVRLSRWWLLAYPLLIAATIVAIILLWDLVPDPVPIHYNSDYKVDDSLAKGPLAIAPLISVQVILALAFAGCQLLCDYVPTDMIHMPFVKLTRENEGEARVLIGGWCLIFGLFMTVWLGFLFVLLVTGNLNRPITMTFTAVFVAVCIASFAILLKRSKRLLRN